MCNSIEIPRFVRAFEGTWGMVVSESERERAIVHTHTYTHSLQVQSLTLQPKVTEGVITYEDSPLVRAVRHGHVLVVDEADKAPTNVTCVLKTLVESGTMTLGDGRRIVPSAECAAREAGDDVIATHPDFRMMVRAECGV